LSKIRNGRRVEHSVQRELLGSGYDGAITVGASEYVPQSRSKLN
jgi:hypothetical protein